MFGGRRHGLRGFYVGYATTVAREIPFAFLQFPIWEQMKKSWAERKGSPLLPWQGALCGSLSGAFAASNTQLVTSLPPFSCKMAPKQDLRCVLLTAPVGSGDKTRVEFRIHSLPPIPLMIDLPGGGNDSS